MCEDAGLKKVSNISKFLQAAKEPWNIFTPDGDQKEQSLGNKLVDLHIGLLRRYAILSSTFLIYTQVVIIESLFPHSWFLQENEPIILKAILLVDKMTV